MNIQKKDILHTGKLILLNGARFLGTLLFVSLYQFLFGQSNMLAGIAVSVALVTLPGCDLQIKPWTMAGIILFLFLGCGIFAQLSVISPYLAFPLQLIWVGLIMLLTCEPVVLKPSVCFLLCFVFCQSTPVPWDQFPSRITGLFIGGLLTSVCTLLVWKHKGYGTNGRSLSEQAVFCAQNHGFILRMSIGIAVAVLFGALLHLKRPLWISIVVMSLTQLEFQETLQRIKHRTAGTFIGSLLFVFLFRVLIPEQYAMLVILLIGYISYFMPAYKHKQVVNAISALDASLVLLDPATALTNRFLCLLGGILIVLFLYLSQKYAEQVYYWLKHRNRPRLT